MARRARLVLPGCPHYVLQSAVHDQLLAQDDADRQTLIDALRDAAAVQGVSVWAYALAGSELHLVVCPANADGLGRMMQMLGRRCVAAFNRRHGRSGALWSGRFRAAVVEPGDWLLDALCRVDSLPADGCSSAGHHLGQARDPWLVEPPEIWSLGNTPFERESAWRQRLERGLDPAREQVLARAVHGAWVAGSPAFCARVAADTGRPPAPRRPGRPAAAR
jgi:putative transposase